MSERPHRREMLEWYAKQAGLSEEQMEQMDVRRREQAENTGERACTEGEEATADEADGDIEIPDEEPPQGWASWSKSMLGAAYTYAMSGSEPPPMTTPETATVDELLEIHADAINQILRRMSVDPLFQPERHDKLWLLRFYLSHKDVEKAANAMSRALATRKEKHLDEIGSIVRSAHPDDWPIAGMLEDLLPVVGLHRWWPDIRGCMLHIGKATDMDMHRLYREHDRFMTIALWGMEYTFQAMDALTRRTGRIQKYVRMLDVQGYPIRSLNLRFVRLLARQQGDLADLYPQLMGATYLVNVPSALKTIWDNLKYLVPPRVLAKTDLLDTTATEDIAKIESWVKMQHLPTFMGGGMDEWPPPKPTSSLEEHLASEWAEDGAEGHFNQLTNA